MRRIVVGVIGHVDHGKTALVRALTGMETDRLAEEQARGISIALGFAHFRDDDVDVDLIDMPGHERFVRMMIAGATGIDAVLLVVAANEGIKPQTREHVDIAGLLGIVRGVVAVTKCDLVTPDEAALVGEEAAALLRQADLAPLSFRGGVGGGDFPPKATFDPEDAHPNPSPEEEGLDARYLLTSVTSGNGLAELREALAMLAADAAPRSDDGVAYLPVDRAFAIPGHGPVVTGTLRGASVRPGVTLELLPVGKRVRVRAAQVHGAPVEAALPGQRTALNLRDVELGELARGMALAEAGTLIASEWLTLALRSVPDAPPLANGMRLRALLGTSEIDARLRLLDRDVLEPGERALAQLRLAEPFAIPAREHVILRIASPARTVAGGRVLEPVVRRRRRHDRLALARLQRLRDLDPAAFVAGEALRADTDLAELARLTALCDVRLRDLLAPLPVVIGRGGVILREADLARLVERLPGMLALHPAGLSRNQLASAVPGTRSAALDEALTRLAARGEVARRGGQWLVPRRNDDLAQAASEAERADGLAEMLRLAGLAPPNPAAILVDAATRRAVERLLRQGTLIRAVDRAKGREILFHKDAIAEAQRRLAPLLADDGPGLLVTEISGALGISRKFTMPLLDHLDTIRFTRRVGDRRVGFATMAR